MADEVLLDKSVSSATGQLNTEGSSVDNTDAKTLGLRRVLLKPVIYIISGLMVVVPAIMCTIFFMQINEMGIRLNSLEAAFRSGQLSQLSSSVATLEKHVADQESRFSTNEKVDAGMQALSAQFEGTIVPLAKKAEENHQRLLQHEERFAVLKSAFDQYLLRLDALSEFKEKFEKTLTNISSSSSSLRTQPANSPTKTKKSTRSAKSVPLAAPFILAGIEQRGGQRYAVVMRRGATTLSEMQLVTVGDSAWGWTLRDMQGHEAIFSVGGSQQRLSVQ
ncbi:hypothetical protein [Brenneria izbisi]|uniref:Plasmid transfer protein n=1 Tax=Brenneria izbisi TaxID=2939450 RepID=A0AA41XXK6_9GAMM|nr:hypothetical protein [Brenneria izbisi]MCV9879274.1 hypothetical protein [Brenneria izbisi]MCV9882692.1 hypothetical protein [Brenneria izbisi]